MKRPELLGTGTPKKTIFTIILLSMPLLLLGITSSPGTMQTAWASAAAPGVGNDQDTTDPPPPEKIPEDPPLSHYQSPAELNQLLSREIGEHGATMGGKIPKKTKGSFALAPFVPSFGVDVRQIDLEPRFALAPFVPSFGVLGSDVSSWQGNVNWDEEWDKGVRFTYVKTTEATSYRNPYHTQQYRGSYRRGIIRGSYHFAIPNVSSGTAQANYFIDNGGRWGADGMTLPPLLDIEYNPYPSLGNTCYNMSHSAMVNWIREFSHTVLARIGRLPTIYTTTDWWEQCTGNNSGFSDHPLYLAAYATQPGRLPNGWPDFDFWQFSSTGPFGGDSSVYNGDIEELRHFAAGDNRGTDQTARVDTLSGYRKASYENNSLGYPATEETCSDSGQNLFCSQTFQGRRRNTGYHSGVYGTPTSQ